MRKVGHEILLFSGDSTSRLRPVQQISEAEYRLSFESSFAFTPDSLVKIIDGTLAANQVEEDYMVHVLDCEQQEVVFGYAILGSEQNEIVPCLGRTVPYNCYVINIRFRTATVAGSSGSFWISGWSVGGLALLLLGFLAYRRRNRGKDLEAKDGNATLDYMPIGRLRFYPEARYLQSEGEKLSLTQKEAQLLHIFAVSPNQVISRERLQADVWESEGVIVGRSLDVYISKLRKKLSKDPRVKLANVHGQGYRLETAQN